MILHIPHASTDTLGKEFLCELNLELDRMTDHRTDELFKHYGIKDITFPISRLICDVERFENDDLEIMSKKGMGVCYTTNSFGEPLRKFTDYEREKILETYYRQHHRALNNAVNLELEMYGKSLIVDCHSFSNLPLPHEDSQTMPRPDICIGTDPFHTPRDLIEFTTQFFESLGYRVSINDPFAGTIIPMEHYHKNRRVQGIMIELNRDLYKDDFDVVRSNVQKYLSQLSFRDNLNLDMIQKIYNNPDMQVPISEIIYDTSELHTALEILAYQLSDLDYIAQYYVEEWVVEMFELELDEEPNDDQVFQAGMKWLNYFLSKPNSWKSTPNVTIICYDRVNLKDDIEVYVAFSIYYIEAQEWSSEGFTELYGIFDNENEIFNQLDKDGYFLDIKDYQYSQKTLDEFREHIINEWFV